MSKRTIGWLLVASMMCTAQARARAEPRADDRPGPRRARALEGMVESTGDDVLRQFIEVHVAPELRESLGAAALIERLRAIRTACSGADGVLLERIEGDGIRVTFLRGERETPVLLRLQPQPPHQIIALDLAPTQASGRAEVQLAPLTWDSLATRLDEEARAGFTGTVLVVRDGKIVLHKGYGLADREHRISNTTDTIFAIGSVPIDFTKAAILELEELGKLRTSDPITRFLKDVPADKQTMTIEHLLRGRSGLRNFHHDAGVDADYDLSYIDRAEGIRRILGQDLLFAPGQGDAHSHSAWVLLAAIVELASGEGYGQFLTNHFFKPAGMTRTGLHEDAMRFADREFAIGYDAGRSGTINIPRYWGKTSWLVMGSGGMQSTPADLYKWIEAIRSGKTLSAASASRYWSHGALAGGDDRGFFCLYTEGPGNLMILCSNAHRGREDRASAVGRRLVELVAGAPQSGR